MRARILIVAVGFLLVFVIGPAWFVWYFVGPSPDVFSPPDEQNRVVHPGGFSIIRPDGMKERLSPEMIVLGPDGGRARYSIGVNVRALPPDLDLARYRADGFADGEFQGQAALIRIGPAGEYDAWQAVFSRLDSHYKISLCFRPAQTGRQCRRQNGFDISRLFGWNRADRWF